MSTPDNIFTGTGRRKTSTARVRISEGSGKLTVNGRNFESYFSHDNFAKQAYAPLLTVDLREKIDVTANVCGGPRHRPRAAEDERRAQARPQEGRPHQA